ncbi:MAG: FkbM family methyltransferase [Bacteroidota bacterium]
MVNPEMQNNILFEKTTKKGFSPNHVAEVGVWHPHTSNIFNYIQDGKKTTLVEPDPDSINLIKSIFGSKKNVSLYEVALCDYNGDVELYQRGSSTFVGSLPSSPAIVNDNFNEDQPDKFVAKAKLFSEIDDGTIDLISIDTEGSEWFVIKNMISRPKVISIETHGGIYVNPYIDNLKKWMLENNYQLWYKDKSDSVYILQNVFTISAIDKISLYKINSIIYFKSNKKRLGKKIKKLFGIKS